MFPRRLFPDRYFPARYFDHEGGAAPSPSPIPAYSRGPDRTELPDDDLYPTI